MTGHSPGPFPSVINPAGGLDVAGAGGAEGEVQTNWNIAVKAAELLERKGYTVRLTRPSVEGPAYVGSVLSTVPVVVIENDPAVVRDNPSGQDRAAAAIAAGIDSYYEQVKAR